MSRSSKLGSSSCYMFAGKHIGFSSCLGWSGIFISLCDEIDQLLGEDKHGFHWVQIKEKMGTARFYWRLSTGEESRHICETKRRISELVDVAVKRTASTCIVCGDAGTLDKSAPHLLTLCARHIAERKAGVKLVIEFD